MNLRSTLFLFLFLLFSVVCWKRYVCKIKNLCSDTPITTEKPIANNPIMFSKNSDTESLFLFDKYVDSIKKIVDSNRIDILGEYLNSETNSTSFENLGLARAAKLKSLFIQKGMDSSKIAIFGREMNSLSSDSLFVATKISISQKIDLNSKEVQIVSNNGVHEIYFPFNSKNEMKSAVLDSFLSQTAQTLGTKKVILTGHTDNVGSEESNKTLSLNRCNTIKSQLIKYGVLESNISSTGMGSTRPKVDNSTAENRSLNRRVELIIK